MIKAIAVDDEILTLKIIETFASKIDDVSLETTFHKQSDAEKYLRKFPVDLIFMDIQMPNKNGLDFYKSLSQDTKVIDRFSGMVWSLWDGHGKWSRKYGI